MAKNLTGLSSKTVGLFCEPHLTGLVITDMASHGAAALDGRLRIGDVILAIDRSATRAKHEAKKEIHSYP